LENKAIQLAKDTLRCILEEASPDSRDAAQFIPLTGREWQDGFSNSEFGMRISELNYSSIPKSEIRNPNSVASLYSDILSINTKDANKITLKLKDDSVVWLSSDYLEYGFCNFKTVFLSKDKNKHYDYIDARFEGLVYCGEKSR
jgi:hypothetical protein